MKLFLAIDVRDEQDARDRLVLLRIMAPDVAEKTDRYCIGPRIGVDTAARGFVEMGEDFETPPEWDESDLRDAGDDAGARPAPGSVTTGTEPGAPIFSEQERDGDGD